MLKRLFVIASRQFFEKSSTWQLWKKNALVKRILFCIISNLNNVFVSKINMLPNRFGALVFCTCSHERDETTPFVQGLIIQSSTK